MDWEGLTVERQFRLAHGADRWLGMSSSERDGAQLRFARWQELPNERRNVIRERYQTYRDMPAAEQERIRRNFRRFHQMRPDRRQELLTVRKILYIIPRHY
jgi:hypothetical protein